MQRPANKATCKIPAKHMHRQRQICPANAEKNQAAKQAWSRPAPPPADVESIYKGPIVCAKQQISTDAQPITTPNAKTKP
jgi:hypothetical protein